MPNLPIFNDAYINEVAEKNNLKHRKELNIFIPGCGDFPSGEEFLDMLIRIFPEAKKIDIWLCEPFLLDENDKVRINSLKPSVAREDDIFSLHLENMGIQKFYETHPTLKMDIIYLEHPEIDVVAAFSKTNADKPFEYRYELLFLNKLMATDGCLLLSTYRTPSELVFAWNLLKHCFKAESLFKRDWYDKWHLGYHTGSGCHIGNTVIAAKPADIDVLTLVEDTKKQDYFFLSVAFGFCVLSSLLTRNIYDSTSSHELLTSLICVMLLPIGIAALRQHDVKNTWSTPVTYFATGVAAAHLSAAAINTIKPGAL